MGIVNTGEGLTQVIINALREAEFEIPKVKDPATGEVEVDTRGLIQEPTQEERDRDFNGLVKFDDPIQPKFDTPYTTSEEPGLEKIAEAIAKEVLNHIVDNGEVAMKTRMDKLEEDFNALLSNLTTSFVPVTGANSLVTIGEYNSMVTNVQAAFLASGGAGREEGTTTPLIEANEKVVPSNLPLGIPVDVQIK